MQYFATKFFEKKSWPLHMQIDEYFSAKGQSNQIRPKVYFKQAKRLKLKTNFPLSFLYYQTKC